MKHAAARAVLPREGATPTEVRIAAWNHAHQAHLMMVGAMDLAALGEDLPMEAALRSAELAGRSAQVAQALMAVLGSPPSTSIPTREDR